MRESSPPQRCLSLLQISSGKEIQTFRGDLIALVAWHTILHHGVLSGFRGRAMR